MFGNAVIISLVYSFNKNLNATGATKIKQNAAPKKIEMIQKVLLLL